MYTLRVEWAGFYWRCMEEIRKIVFKCSMLVWVAKRLPKALYGCLF